MVHAAVGRGRERVPDDVVDLEPRVGRRDVPLLEPELAAEDVRALGDRRRLVERDQPVAALAAEAAVATRGSGSPGRSRCERAPPELGDLLRRLDLQRPVADDPDRDLLAQPVAVRREELELALVAVLQLDRPDVAR